jgi:chromosome segregation ATPase
MAGKKVNIDITTTANTAGAKQAEKAMDGLAQSSNRVSTAGQAAGKSASRVGQLAGQAGFQVQDFAVQVGGGTSALTAFSQQAPQLLGAFGPGGAIAGAIVAIGAIATQVFLKMGDDALTADEKAKKLADKLEEVREAAEKAISDKIDFGRQKIEDATTKAGLLADELNTVATNQLRLNQAVLDSLTEINQAERALDELRGQSGDKLKLQSEQAANEAKRRDQQVAIQIAAEEQQLKVAREALDIAKSDLLLKQKQKEEAVLSLQAEKDALKAAEDRLKSTKLLSGQTAFQSVGGGLAGGLPVVTQAARGAQGELASGKIQEQIETLKANVEGITKAVSSTGELTSQVDEAIRQVIAVESALTQKVSDVQTSIESINIEATTEGITETARQLSERATLLADEVKSITEGVTASTASEKQSLEVIKKNLSDGAITLDEIRSTSAALGQLDPQIREAINGNTQKVSQLITIMQRFQIETAQLQRRIDMIQSRQISPLKQN